MDFIIGKVCVLVVINETGVVISGGEVAVKLVGPVSPESEGNSWPVVSVRIPEISGKIGHPSVNVSSVSSVGSHASEKRHESISSVNISGVHHPVISDDIGLENDVLFVQNVNQIFVFGNLFHNLILDLHINHNVSFNLVNVNLNSFFEDG